MTFRQTTTCLALLLCGRLAAVAAGERVFPLDIAAAHDPADKVQVREIAAGEYEWSLPDGVGQTLNIDLRRMGVDPHDYDELRFDIKPLGSQVDLHATLFGMPDERSAASWYLKFRTATDQWSTGRYDLRVDDDGAAYPDRFKGKPGTLRLELGRRVLGYAGEPQWRKAILRNPRLIRWAVAAGFEPRDVTIKGDGAAITYTYPLTVANRTAAALTATIEIDPDGGLDAFRAEPAGTIEVELAAGAEKVVPITLSLAPGRGADLAPGHAERICPRVSVAGVADSDVQPLLGYRPMPMWAVVPVAPPPLTPATFQARVAEAAETMNVEGWKSRVLGFADETLRYDWPVLDWVAPGKDPLQTPFYGFCYACPECKSRDFMRRDPPNSTTRHFCRRCNKHFQNNEGGLDDCARKENFADFFRRVRGLALAWLLTGEAKYADKAIVMATAFAAAHPEMTVVGERSCGTSTRLSTYNLGAAWNLPALAEARVMLAGYPGLTGESRSKWDALLLDEALRVTRQCGLFLNQQDEYVRTGITAAVATGYWPLLGEAIAGDFGWHAQVEYGFSEDGIGHEGSAYHNMKTNCMFETAAFADDLGVDLLTPRFKRVYDGTLTVGGGGHPGYEVAYRKYRDPAYVPGIEGLRVNPGEHSILHGVPRIPKAADLRVESKLMEGSGFVFLRKGSPVDSREIRLNYRAQFDRGEADRFGTWFFRNSRQVDSGVGRCAYTEPGAAFMGETAAHNCIVIDGQNSRDVVGELVAWRGDGDAPFAVVATDPAAPLFAGVQQIRGIALVGGAYVVFDRAVCDAPRTIDRYQYGPGKAVVQFPAAPPTAALPKLNEKGRFTAVVAAPVGREMQIDYGGDLRMRLACDRDMTGCRAQTPRTASQPIDVTWARVDAATDATFLAAFSLGKDVEPPAVRIMKSGADEIVLALEDRDRTWTWTIQPRSKRAEIVPGEPTP